MRSPTAATSIAGAAFRTVAGRSPFHAHLKESTNTKARSTRPITAAAEAMRHYHSRILARTPRCCAIQQGRTSVPNNLASRLLSTKAAPTSTANPTEQKPTRRRKSSFISPRYAALLVLLAVAGVAWDSQWLFPSPVPSDPAHRTVFGDARKFVRFDVIGREQVSPTSFILTLKAPAVIANHPFLSGVSSLWDVFDLWCVEVKQPQIQVAREYTPLPPLTSVSESESEPAADGTVHHHHHHQQEEKDTLRLYVRAVRGGEVSTYLSRLSPPAVDASGSGKVRNGDTVELRGPHGEFDLRSRLGASGDRVVFLAGGTGIASALQAAHAVLPLPSAPSMTIFWAVRSRDEIQGVGAGSEDPRSPSAASSSSSWLSWSSWNPFSRQPEKKSAESVIQANEALPTGKEGGVRDPSPITRELLALKKKYGGRLDVRFVVDEEGARVQEPDLAATLLVTRNSSIKRADSSFSSIAEPASATDCKFHSQAAHASMVDGAPNAGKLLGGGDCACLGPGAAKGKNLLVVSGPEGFVQAYAGPKVWRDGGQLQGAVGGMLGRMQRGNPGLLRDWVVLKL